MRFSRMWRSRSRCLVNAYRCYYRTKLRNNPEDHSQFNTTSLYSSITIEPGDNVHERQTRGFYCSPSRSDWLKKLSSILPHLNLHEHILCCNRIFVEKVHTGSVDPSYTPVWDRIAYRSQQHDRRWDHQVFWRQSRPKWSSWASYTQYGLCWRVRPPRGV